MGQWGGPRAATAVRGLYVITTPLEQEQEQAQEQEDPRGILEVAHERGPVALPLALESLAMVPMPRLVPESVALFAFAFALALSVRIPALSGPERACNLPGAFPHGIA